MNYFIKNLIIILATLVLFFTVNHVLAAKFYFDPASGNFSEDSVLSVELKINTEDLPVNTIEGHLKFSQDIFSLAGLSDGNSIISFWLKKPAAENGLISFAGIIPGGYGGRDGTLVKIILRPLKTGQGKIEILPDSQVLLNDSQGTQASVKYSAASFNITKGGVQLQITKDTEPPESFSPQISSDPTIFEGQWFLAFSTQDKNSGIDHYEIAEKRGQKTQNYAELSWGKAESPYSLKDRELKSYIYVKAVDKSGNQIIVIVPPLSPWYKSPLWYAVFGTGILIVIVLIMWLWRKLSAKKRE